MSTLAREEGNPRGTCLQRQPAPKPLHRLLQVIESGEWARAQAAKREAHLRNSGVRQRSNRLTRTARIMAKWEADQPESTPVEQGA